MVNLLLRRFGFEDRVYPVLTVSPAVAKSRTAQKGGPEVTQSMLSVGRLAITPLASPKYSSPRRRERPAAAAPASAGHLQSGLVGHVLVQPMDQALIAEAVEDGREGPTLDQLAQESDEHRQAVRAADPGAGGAQGHQACATDRARAI